MPLAEARRHSDDGNRSKLASSMDGKGGTESTPDVFKAGVRSIYYRLYTKDGPLESNNPIYSDDQFISTISSNSLRPPRTAASLKKYICKVEGLGAFENCTLYQSLSDKTALQDSTRLSFQGTPRPGTSDRDPLSLVFNRTSGFNKRSQSASKVDPPTLLERDYEQRFVYYVVYDDAGEAVSKTSFAHNNPSLGRVNTLFIPPPHTVCSLKGYLIKTEMILGHNVELFADGDSDSPMDDNDPIALLADKFQGCVQDRPLAMTYEPQAAVSPVNKEDPNEILVRNLHEARSAMAQLKKELEEAKTAHMDELTQMRKEFKKATETHARELSDARFALGRMEEESKRLNEVHARVLDAAQPLTQALLERPSFIKKIRATTDDDNPYDSRWHSMKAGDIFFTDGIPRKEKYIFPSTQFSDVPCYMAINSSGKLAFVYQPRTTLC